MIEPLSDPLITTDVGVRQPVSQAGHLADQPLAWMSGRLRRYRWVILLVLLPALAGRHGG